MKFGLFFGPPTTTLVGPLLKFLAEKILNFSKARSILLDANVSQPSITNLSFYVDHITDQHSVASSQLSALHSTPLELSQSLFHSFTGSGVIQLRFVDPSWSE